MQQNNPWDLKTPMLEVIKQNGGFVNCHAHFDKAYYINHEGLELEFRKGIKTVVKRIEKYIEKDNIRSLNTNSIELYKDLWIDIEKLENHPDKKKLIENWTYFVS